MKTLDEFKQELQERTQMKWAHLYFAENVSTLDTLFGSFEQACKEQVNALRGGKHGDNVLEDAANRQVQMTYKSLYSHVSKSKEVPERTPLYTETAKRLGSLTPSQAYYPASKELREQISVPFLEFTHGAEYVLKTVANKYHYHTEIMVRTQTLTEREYDLVIEAAEDLFADFQKQVLGSHTTIKPLYEHRDPPQRPSERCGIKSSR